MLPLPLLASDPTAVEPPLPVCWVRETLVRTEMDEEVIHAFSFFVSRGKRKALGFIHTLLMLQAGSH